MTAREHEALRQIRIDRIETRLTFLMDAIVEAFEDDKVRRETISALYKAVLNLRNEGKLK
jgi:hypothetical protein